MMTFKDDRQAQPETPRISTSSILPGATHILSALALGLLLVLSPIPHVGAQQSTTPQTTAPQQTTPPTTAPEEGPTTDNGGIIIRKKTQPTEPEPAPAPEQPKVKNPDNATYSLRVDVPIVNLDVNVILDKTHQFVPGLKGGNFPCAGRWRRAEGHERSHGADSYYGRHAA